MRKSDGIFELGYVPGGGHKNLKIIDRASIFMPHAAPVEHNYSTASRGRRIFANFVKKLAAPFANLLFGSINPL